MKAYKFEDFQVGMVEINEHKVEVVACIHSVENGNCGHLIQAAVDGGNTKKYPVAKLCDLLGVEYAKVRKGSTSGTRVVSCKSEEERIAAKARVAFKDATKGLEAMEAAGLLSGRALANAKKDLAAKIEAERVRLTAEAIAEKAKKAEEAKAKKAEKAAASKFEKAAKALDVFGPVALAQFLDTYLEARGLADTMKVAKTEVTE